MKPLGERRMFIESGHDKLSIVKQCELLEVSRFYYEPVNESEENLDILRTLDKQYMDTPFYGVEKLLVLLTALGYKINRKRLRRLIMYERKLKQKELARLLGVGEPKLSQIMRRKSKPDIAFLKAAHKLLGIDGNVLLDFA